MRSLSITEAIENGFQAFKRRGWYLTWLSAAVLIISIFLVGDAVTTALYSIVVAGYIVVLLAHARQEHVVFDDLFIADSRWIYYAFGSVLKALIILVGLIAFVLPGIYLSIKLMFSDVYILDKGMRPMEALKASYDLTTGYFWTLFLFCLVTVLILLLGLLAFGVGIFAAVPITGLAYIFAFWKLQELQYLNSQDKQ